MAAALSRYSSPLLGGAFEAVAVAGPTRQLGVRVPVATVTVIGAAAVVARGLVVGEHLPVVAGLDDAAVGGAYITSWAFRTV
jgi:hypothetical protein